MKMAIIGSGARALEAAHEFASLGADVTLFCPYGIAGKLSLASDQLANISIPAAWQVSSQLLKKLNIDSPTDLKDLVNTTLPQVAMALEGQARFINAKVERFHKRFLSQSEEIAGKSRFFDLFRVVYKVEPSSEIARQRNEDPETFKALPEELVRSLETGVEAFEDFDLVIEAPGPWENPLPMGPSHSQALNEQALAPNASVYYGVDALAALEQIASKEKVLVVGTGLLSAIATNYLAKLERLDSGKSIIVISSEKRPFAALSKQNENRDLSAKVEQSMEVYAKHWQHLCENYEQQLHQWRDLPSHERAKIAAPQLPTPSFDILAGANITSLDRLLDREGLFVTIEVPEFRGEESLKTLACDAIIVVTGHAPYQSLATGLVPGERGHFILHGDLDQTATIVDNVLALFSRIS
jgi:siroheme synthase (precorrin-2 oxidase/ferrochelatase)